MQRMQLTILNVWWHFWTDLSRTYFTCVMLSETFLMQLGRNMMILITLIRHQKVGYLKQLKFCILFCLLKLLKLAKVAIAFQVAT